MLNELGVPQPRGWVARNRIDLGAVDTFPVFVKRPISTASTGIQRASNYDELLVAATAVGIDGGAVVVQKEARGPLAMVQLLADRGRLVACHAALRVREGSSGGAAAKQSIVLPEIEAAAEALSQGLAWHGPLSFDAILSPEGIQVIDVNPRLVEPANAFLSGIDLVSVILQLAQGGHPVTPARSQANVRSHQLLIALLAAAHQPGPRRAVARELFFALTRRDSYAEGVEELTPVTGDSLAALPVAAVALATLFAPGTSRWFEGGAVSSYSLTPDGWDEILRAARARAGPEPAPREQ